MRRQTITLLLGISLSAPLAAQKPSLSDLKTHFSVDYTTQYFFRGIVQKTGGMMLQPELQIAGEINDSVTWRTGLWNTLTEAGPPGSKMWYEADWYFGVDIAVADNMALDAAYVVYDSPNFNFATTQELRFTFTMGHQKEENDDFLKRLRPHARLAFELDGGRDAFVDEGIYLELGIDPKLDVSDKVDVFVPVKLGLGLKDYYQDATGDNDFFGYLSLGVRGEMPLEFLTSDPWKLRGGLEVLILGDNTERFNNGDAFELIGSIGISVDF